MQTMSTVTGWMRRPVVVAFGALSLGGCLVGCSAATAADHPGPAAPSVAAVGHPVELRSSDQPLLDARATRFRHALVEAGIRVGPSNATTLLLAQGICDQLAAGTPEATILEQLWPIAAYSATVSQAPLRGDAAAHLYLDTARSTYC